MKPETPEGRKAEHEWICNDPRWPSATKDLTVCVRCGVVQRRDGKNKPCTGVLPKIVLRQPPTNPEPPAPTTFWVLEKPGPVYWDGGHAESSTEKIDAAIQWRREQDVFPQHRHLAQWGWAIVEHGYITEPPAPTPPLVQEARQQLLSGDFGRPSSKAYRWVDTLASEVSSQADEIAFLRTRDARAEEVIQGRNKRLSELVAECDALQSRLAETERDKEAQQENYQKLVNYCAGVKRQAEADAQRAREALEAAIKLAKEATNGWACYAKRIPEHREIKRLHDELAALTAPPPPKERT